MLLVCPKCVAQYEVDDQAIPEGGREVQCASCDHIWFQDQLKMLAGQPGGEGVPIDSGFDTPQGSDIFQDLDGVKDVEFRTAREGSDVSVLADKTDTQELAENILNEEFDEDHYEDDAPMELPEGGLKVDQDVLDVLRSEAAFSSARNKEDSAPEQADEVEDDDDLAAFLNAHIEDAADDVVDAGPEHEIQEDTAEYDEALPAAAPSFDPLSDLDAIRSQLDNIGNASQEDDAEIVYEPMLPEGDDNPVEDTSGTSDDADVAAIMASLDQEEPASADAENEILEPAEDESLDISYDNAEDQLEYDTDSEPEIDEFDEYVPRRAFRSDGAGAELDDDIIGFDNTDDERNLTPDSTLKPTFFENSDQEIDNFDSNTQDDKSFESGSAIPAAVALGALRPRSNGGSARVRSINIPEDIIAQQLDAVDTPASAQPLTRPTRPETNGRTARPGAGGPIDSTSSPETKAVSRKELLPDVEELNSTLRAESVPEMQITGDAKPENKSGSFIRSLAITLLLLALLIGLYAMKPAIVSAIPALAVVLDPYVSFIDSLRLMIEAALG